ncbi:HNH endonuclease [Streptomyces griseoaurantiacus]|uniref:HNH endonuclease n=1 Tax=Streptomyces griseoaurantiacus TaxID=68213 RepID=UPI0037BB2B4A
MSAARADLSPQLRTFLHCRLRELHGGRCFYCRRNFRRRPGRRKTLDHYVPHRIWPGWNVENLVLACEGCNLAKGDVLPWPLAWLLLAVFRRENWGLTA